MTNIMQDKNINIGKQLDDATKATNVDSKAENIKNQETDSITNGNKLNNYSFSGSASSGTDFQNQSGVQGFGLGNISFSQASPVANGYTNMPNQQGNINKNIGQGLGNLGTYGWNQNLGNNIQSGKDYKISAGAELI